MTQRVSLQTLVPAVGNLKDRKSSRNRSFAILVLMIGHLATITENQNHGKRASAGGAGVLLPLCIRRGLGSSPRCGYRAR